MGKNISYGCGREIILIKVPVLNWEYIRGVNLIGMWISALL